METRKQAWTVAYEQFAIGATATIGSSAITVEGVGVASCASSTTGEYVFTLNDKWADLVAAAPAIELDHDAIALTELYTLANDLKDQYEAHRVLTTGTVHGAADATNVVTAADATTQATLYLLLNDLKAQYEAHRVLTTSSVHGAADATNVVSAADATTLATAITLANELKVDYEAHRILTAASVHGAADATDVVTADSVTLATTPYASIKSKDLTSAKTITVVTKDPTSGANAALKAGGKIHLAMHASRKAL